VRTLSREERETRMEVVQEDVGAHPFDPYSLCARRADEGWRRVTWLTELWNVLVDAFFEEDSCVLRIEIPDRKRASAPGGGDGAVAPPCPRGHKQHGEDDEQPSL
jgi:hypothetical protein